MIKRKFYHDFRIKDVVYHLFYPYFRNQYLCGFGDTAPSEKVETQINLYRKSFENLLKQLCRQKQPSSYGVFEVDHSS